MDNLFSDREDDLVARFERMLEEGRSEFFDSHELVEIAEHYIDSGELNKARELLDFAHDLFPEHFELQLKEAEYYLCSEDAVNASRVLETLYEIAPDDTEVLILAAKLCSLKGSHHLAISLLARALPKADEQDEVYGILGMEYYNIGQYRKALHFYRKSLAIDPDNEFDFFNALHCFEAMDESKACIAFIEGFIDENPYSETAWNQLGLQQERRHNYKEAIRAYDYAIVIDEKFMSAYYAKAAVLERVHRFDEAIAVYAETLSLSDTPAFGNYKIGRCYRRINQLKKALNAFHQAAEQDPTQDSNWSEIALVHLRLGAFDKALRYTLRAAQCNPQYTGYWKRIAYLNTRLNRLEEADQTYRKLLELGVRDHAVWENYAKLLIHRGRYEEAIELLRVGVPLCRTRATPLALLACAHLLASKPTRAKAYMRQALHLDKKIKTHMRKCFPQLAGSTLLINPTAKDNRSQTAGVSPASLP